MSGTLSVNANEGQPARQVHFVVTGFGPFRDAPENPTTIIANKIVDHLEQRNPNEHHENNEQTRPLKITPMVLEVSVEAVKEALNELETKLRKTAGDVSSSAVTTTVLLHLGVNYKGTGFQLEQCAYNDATFRIPDERGYQPTKECVIPSMEWGKAVHTTLNLQSIGQKLKQKYNCEILTKQEVQAQAINNNKGNSENATAQGENPILIIHSDDPGRYVCNYTYCYSLEKFCSSSSEKGPRFYALFLHVPPFRIIGEEKQMEFVAELIRLIEEEVPQQDD